MMLAILLLAQAPAEAPQWNCDEPIAQQEMNWCSHQDYLAADAQMNTQWKYTAARMKELDASYADATDGDHPHFFDTLLEAQRAWLKYRDAHCTGEGNMFSGGSMEPLIINGCKTRLTKQRTEQLGVLVGIDG